MQEEKERGVSQIWNGRERDQGKSGQMIAEKSERARERKRRRDREGMRKMDREIETYARWIEQKFQRLRTREKERD